MIVTPIYFLLIPKILYTCIKNRISKKFKYSSVNLLGTRLLGTNGIFEKNLLWTF